MIYINRLLPIIFFYFGLLDSLSFYFQSSFCHCNCLRKALPLVVPSSLAPVVASLFWLVHHSPPFFFSPNFFGFGLLHLPLYLKAICSSFFFLCHLDLFFNSSFSTYLLMIVMFGVKTPVAAMVANHHLLELDPRVILGLSPWLAPLLGTRSLHPIVQIVLCIGLKIFGVWAKKSHALSRMT